MSHAEPLSRESYAGADLVDVSSDTRIFTASVAISGVRCLLAYIVFPWVLPLLGIAGGVGPAVGIVIGAVAIGFNIASIRRFWASGHRWRWTISAVNVIAIISLTVLIAIDVSDLAG